MSNVRKKIYVVLTITMVLTVIFAHTRETYSAELTIPEKALSIITDVVGLDTKKYDVELSSYFSDYPDEYEGRLQENIVYTLQSASSEIRVISTFVNKTLWYVDINTNTNSLLSEHYAKQLPTGVLDGTRELLQRLQLSTDASYIQEISSTLDSVSDVNSLNSTVGNLKRKVIVNTEVVYHNATLNYTSLSTSIYFMCTVNDADSPKSVNIHFKDGALTGFSNGWALFTIGSESVKISKEEAINISREQADSLTAVVLNYGDRPIRAELHMFPRESFELYPFWFVELPLDYSNSTITGWQVGIWADTGKIAYSHPTGVLGSSSIPTPELLPTDPQPEDTENGQLNTYIIIGIASVIVAVATIAVALKKRVR